MRILITLTAAALLGACAIGTDYKRPPVDTPAAFRDAPAASGKPLAELAWWELYRDPVLEKLVKVALVQNFDVRIAMARVEEYRALAGVANIGSIPLIAAGGNATRNAYSTVGPTPFPSTFPTVNQSYTPNLTVSYEIDFWRRVADLQAAARAQLLATEYARETTRITVIANVASAYFALRTQDRELAVTQRSVAAREKFAVLTRAQFARGVVSALDLTRAEANVAAARATVSDLQRQITQSENLLQVLLGQNPAPILREAATEGALLPESPEVPTGLPSALLERRPDLRQAENNLISANAQLKSVKASLFPTISLTGSLGSTSATLANLFTGPSKVWTLGLSALQPLIDPTRNFYQVDAYSAREKQAILSYQQAVVQAFREVSDALAARQGYAEFERAQQDQVKSLREAQQLVMKRYASGYSSYFEVIDADSTLLNAELQLALAQQNNLLALVQLYKALGGGWQQVAADAPKAADAAADASH